jgi:hypothetical protein
LIDSWANALRATIYTRLAWNQMIFESFLHTSEEGKFFIRLKATGGKIKTPPDGELKEEIWFGPFDTEDESVKLAGFLHEAVQNPKYHDTDREFVN